MLKLFYQKNVALSILFMIFFVLPVAGSWGIDLRGVLGGSMEIIHLRFRHCPDIFFVFLS